MSAQNSDFEDSEHPPSDRQLAVGINFQALFCGGDGRETIQAGWRVRTAPGTDPGFVIVPGRRLVSFPYILGARLA